VRGPTKYQSVKVASKQDIGGGNWTLTGSTANLERWADGLNTQNTCLHNIGVGETVGQCVYPAGGQTILPQHLMDEMAFDLAALRKAHPQLFIWGPVIAGGNRTKLQFWHDNGDWSQVNGTCFNYYSNDATLDGGFAYGNDPGPSKFFDTYAAGLDLVVRKIKSLTKHGLATKPIGVFEVGIRAQDWMGTTPYSETKHSLYARYFINGLRGLRSEITHVAYWGMGREKTTVPTSATWDLATGPVGNESTSATAYTRLVEALLFTRTAPAAFANAGSGGSVPSGEPPVIPEV